MTTATNGRRRARPIARSNSSLLGSLGTLFSSSLNWFKSPEAEYEDEQDESGKRNRALDDSEQPVKRQRVASPEPYLDPPKALFQRQTMSIDPPPHTVLPKIAEERDHSMPPIRSPFKMRSSLTPQPTREVSEPPSLTSLIQRPMFIHPPAERPRKLSAPPTTLGTLVESQRSTRSPSRSHSLLFGTSPSPEKPKSNLQDLDVYKTPLVPTRLRATASLDRADNITDLFRPRRSKLVPMFDEDGVERKTKKKSKKKAKEVNDTKPYAGEGGMKRLLAKRREEEEESSRKDDKEIEKLKEDVSMSSPLPTPKAPSNDLPKEDWLALANAGAKEKQRPSESSLRVGRTLTERKHLNRPGPLGPVRSKYSASYEEDEGDTEDKKMLEEAAKRAPVFEIPNGFTFESSKKVIPDKSDAKEPPISSLPFSFGAPSPKVPAKSPPLAVPTAPVVAPATPPPEESGSTGVPKFFANVKETPPPVPPPSSLFALAPAPALPEPAAPSLFSPPAKDDTSMFDSEKKAAKSGGFFSFEKGKENIADSSSAASTSGTALFGAAKKEGEKVFSSFNPAQSVPAFSFEKPTESKTEANNLFASRPAPTPLFGDTPKPLISFSTPSATTEPPKSMVPVEPSKPPSEPTKSLFGAASKPSFGTTVDPPKPLFSAPAEKSPFGAEAPKPLFGSTTSETKSLFGSGEAPKPLFGTSAPTFNARTPQSLFGETKPSEQPKPMFGGFDNTKTEASSVQSNPFDSQAPKPSSGSGMFSFAPSSSSSAAPPSAPFSFGSASTNDANKPFVFGAPAPTSRAVTPPRNDSQDVGDRMDESPTRDLGNAKPAEPRPTLGGGSFSFPSSSSSSNPFSFGVSSTSTSFGASKPEENKPAFGSGFGQAPASTSSPFAFNAKPASEDPPRPSTTGSFSFSNSTSSGSTSSFAFGASDTTNNPFVQHPGGSAPSSPSTFSTQPSFTFGQPSTSNPFTTFGSQPSSPAASSSSLPPPAAGSGPFAFGGGSSQPSTPFGAPAPSTGGTLFNMGSAAPPNQQGARQIKKLPTRRGAKR